MKSPEQFARRLAQDIKESPIGVERRLLKTVINGSGWVRRSPQNLAAIAAALASERIQWDEERALTDMHYPLGSWVSFSFDPFRKPSRVFIDETAMNLFLERYHDTAFAKVPEIAGLRLLGRQHSAKHGSHSYRLDLLFEASDGTKVIVELKDGQPEAKAVGELQKYSKAYIAKGQPVQGVLITAKPATRIVEQNMRELLAALPFPTAWYWYDLRVSLTKIL